MVAVVEAVGDRIIPAVVAVAVVANTGSHKNLIVENKNIFSIWEENILQSFPRTIKLKTLINELKTWPVRISVSSSDFHSGKRGSIPLQATNKLLEITYQRQLFFFTL